MNKKQASELKSIEEVSTFWDVLTPDERQFVKSSSSVHHFRKNEMIHCEGDTPTPTVFIMLAGKGVIPYLVIQI